MDRVSVLVAADHPLFREAIVRAVRERPEFSLAGEAEHGRATPKASRELSPDVAVLDLRMPGLEVASRPGEGTLVRVSIPVRSTVPA
jgi:two-component system, NarL family, nitrate/nitrite response regulator NarL